MVDSTISPSGRAIWRVWAAPGPAPRPLRGRSAGPSASAAEPVTVTFLPCS